MDPRFHMLVIPQGQEAFKPGSAARAEQLQCIVHTQKAISNQAGGPASGGDLALGSPRAGSQRGLCPACWKLEARCVPAVGWGGGGLALVH